jgi:hypothetical protein
VYANGLTGSISFQDKQRKEFELDVLQLKETGLFKCGSWSNEHGLNFTFYDEVYEEEANSLKKGTLRVVTLVVSSSGFYPALLFSTPLRIALNLPSQKMTKKNIRMFEQDNALNFNFQHHWH